MLENIEHGEIHGFTCPINWKYVSGKFLFFVHSFSFSCAHKTSFKYYSQTVGTILVTWVFIFYNIMYLKIQIWASIRIVHSLGKSVGPLSLMNWVQSSSPIGENGLLKIIPWPPHVCHGMCTPAYTHITHINMHKSIHKKQQLLIIKSILGKYEYFRHFWLYWLLPLCF